MVSKTLTKSCGAEYLTFEEKVGIAEKVADDNRLKYHFCKNPCAVFLADFLFILCGGNYKELSKEIEHYGVDGTSRKDSICHFLSDHFYRQAFIPDELDIVLMDSPTVHLGVFFDSHILFLSMSGKVVCEPLSETPKPLTFFRKK